MEKVGTSTPKSLEESQKRKMHINAIVKKRPTETVLLKNNINRCLTGERGRGEKDFEYEDG